jgi:hypothetical protein
MENLANKSKDDDDVIELLKGQYAGSTDNRGTLSRMMASFSAPKDTSTFNDVWFCVIDVRSFSFKERIVLPSQCKKVNLRVIADSVYNLVWSALQDLWRSSVKLNYDNSTAADRENFMGRAISYSHIFVERVRYGAGAEARGLGTRFAYIDGRIPVQILHLFAVTHERSDETLENLTAVIAVVQRLMKFGHTPSMPWDLQ